MGVIRRKRRALPSERPRIKRLRRIGFAVVILLSVSLGWAAPAAADIGVAVDSPSGKYYEPGKPIFLVVTVNADRAVEGSIVVSDNGTREVVVEQSFDAAGGGSKEILIRVPRIEQGLDVVVKTSDGDDERIRSTFQPVGDLQPVGLSPGLVSPSNPRQTPMANGLGSAVLLPFDPSLLDNGPEILGHHNALLMSEVDFEALSQAQSDALFFWVAHGGRLVLDSAVGEPPAGLPVTFDGAPRAWHGVGTIQLADGRLVEGQYDGLLSSRNLGGGNNSGGFGPLDTNNGVEQLIHDAVIPTLPVDVLTLALALYILGIGPVAWFWLRRRNRLPMIWVAVPLVAIVSTAVIWGIGTVLRGSSTGAHVTLVADFAGTSEVRSQYIVSSASGGFTGVALEQGWQQSTVFDSAYDPWSGESFEQPVRRGDVVGFDLTPGSSTVVGAAKFGTDEPSWRIEASGDDNQIVGTVTNLTEHRLEQVIIGGAAGAEVISAVGSGETVDFRIDGSARPGRSTHDQVAQNLKRYSGDGQAASAGIYEQWAESVPDSNDGFVVVVGWSTELAAPLEPTSGDRFESGRTGFVSMVPLQSDAQDGSGTVGRVILTDQSWYEYENNVLVDGSNQRFFELLATYTVELGDAEPTDELAIDFDETMQAADFWNGEDWISSGLSTAPGTATTDASVGVPTSAIIDGVVVFRVGVYPDGQGLSYDESQTLNSLATPHVRVAEPGENLIYNEGSG